MIFLSKMMSIPFKILFIIFVYFESFKFIFWFFFLALRPIPCSFKTRTIIIWFLPIIFYIFDLFMAGMPLMMVPVMIWLRIAFRWLLRLIAIFFVTLNLIMQILTPICYLSAVNSISAWDGTFIHHLHNKYILD